MKRRETILILALAGLLSTAALSAQEAPPTEPQPTAPTEEIVAAPSAPASEETSADAAPSATESETPGTAPTDETAPPPAPAEDRITFELTFPPEKGGGSATGSAGGLETRGEDEAIATGGVEVHYQDVVLTADRVVFHRQTKSVEAEGKVVVDQGPGRILGERLTFDLETKTGTFYHASAHLNPDYYFTGDEISKVGENSYTVRDGVFTSCTGDPTPDWSFRLARARVEIEGYARIRHASMWVKKLPVFYTPYILWPAKTERTSGFLIPNIGYSESRGTYVGLAYFQTLGRSF